MTDVQAAKMAHSDKTSAINYQIDNVIALCMNRTSVSATSVLQAIQPTTGNPFEQPDVALTMPKVAKTVLQHTLDAAWGSGLPWHPEDEGHTGMGDSIAAAVQKTSQANGWLILPADLPLIQSGSLKAVAIALMNREVVVPVYQGQRGHPVGFSVVCRQALLGLRGDNRAARVCRLHVAMELQLDDMGCVTDIDTKEDLEAAELMLSRMETATIPLSR